MISFQRVCLTVSPTNWNPFCDLFCVDFVLRSHYFNAFKVILSPNSRPLYYHVGSYFVNTFVDFVVISNYRFDALPFYHQIGSHLSLILCGFRSHFFHIWNHVVTDFAATLPSSWKAFCHRICVALESLCHQIRRHLTYFSSNISWIWFKEIV